MHFTYKEHGYRVIQISNLRFLQKFVKILFLQQFQLVFQFGAPRCSHPPNNPVENLVEDSFFPCVFTFLWPQN